MSTHQLIPDWAIVVDIQFVDTLFPLRLFEHIEIAEAGDKLWLRGRHSTAAVSTILNAIPVSERFSWLSEDKLRPANSRFATARFPEGNWQLLSKWLQVALPLAALPATVRTKQGLQLLASAYCEEANALLTRTEVWAKWAAQAPAIRLKPLKFAASDNNRSLVLGLPLPPIAGQRMLAKDGIVTPAGTTWSPHVSSVTVREVLGVGSETCVLWEQSAVHILPGELFVPASRAAAQTLLQSTRKTL